MDDSPAIGGEALPAGGTPPSDASVAPAWEFSASNAGAAITLRVDEAEELRIACAREPLLLMVDVPGFSSIGSEERLSLGLDNEPYVFVAQVTPPPPAGVHAERQADEEFIELLGRARTISAFYGAQSTGPHMAPDSETAGLFRTACLEAINAG